MTDPKRYETEWTFDFGTLGERIAQAVGADDEQLQPKSAQFSAALGNASSAAIQLDFSLGRVTLEAGAAGDPLFFADVTYLGELEFAESGDLDKSISLKQKKSVKVNDFMLGLRQLFGRISNKAEMEQLKWHVRLNPSIPLDVTLSGGVGPATLDLSALKLRRFSVNLGVGEIHLTLPAMPERYAIRLEGGVGPSHVTIADNALVDLDLEGGVGPITLTLGKNAQVKLTATSGVGSTRITLGAGSSGDISISGGVGATTLELPEDVAARVISTSGLGAVSVASRFTRTAEGHDTPGYAVAQQRLTVHYSGGIGSFTVR